MGNEREDLHGYRSRDPELGDREALKRLVEAKTKVPMTEPAIRRSGFSERMILAWFAAGVFVMACRLYDLWMRDQPGPPPAGLFASWYPCLLIAVSMFGVGAIVFLAIRWWQRLTRRKVAERPADVLCGHYEQRVTAIDGRLERALGSLAITRRPTTSPSVTSSRRYAVQRALFVYFTHLSHLIAQLRGLVDTCSIYAVEEASREIEGRLQALADLDRVVHGTAGQEAGDGAWLEHVELALRRLPLVPRLQADESTAVPELRDEVPDDGYGGASEASLFGEGATFTAGGKG